MVTLFHLSIYFMYNSSHFAVKGEIRLVCRHDVLCSAPGLLIRQPFDSRKSDHHYVISEMMQQDTHFMDLLALTSHSE